MLHQRRMESTSRLQLPTLHQRRIGEYIALAVSLRCTSARWRVRHACSNLRCTSAGLDSKYIAPAVSLRCTNAGWRVRRACSVTYATPARTENSLCLQCPYAAPALEEEYIAPAVSNAAPAQMESTSRLQWPLRCTSVGRRVHCACSDLHCTSAGWRVHRACSVLTLHQRQMESTSRLQ